MNDIYYIKINIHMLNVEEQWLLKKKKQENKDEIDQV
jgi:hypothetical protein